MAKVRTLTDEPFTSTTRNRLSVFFMRIDHDGEQLYLFDLNSKECFLPQSRDPETGKLRRPQAILPVEWRDSFGMGVEAHAASTQVDLTKGYVTAEMAQQEEDAPLITAQIE